MACRGGEDEQVTGEVVLLRLCARASTSRDLRLLFTLGLAKEESASVDSFITTDDRFESTSYEESALGCM